MFKFLKKTNKIVAVCDGIINSLNEFPDDAISSLVLGDGFMIEPDNGKIVSPIDGEVVMIFPTGHAIGIKNSEYEILIHVGVDTVNLAGKGFINKVEVGEKVKAGQEISQFNFDQVRKSPEVKSVAVAVIFTGLNKNINLLENNTHVSAGQAEILTIK